MGKISPLGIILIDFNHPFKVPSEGYDYSSTFKISMVSSVDESVASGKFMKNSRRLLEEKVCSDCEAAHKQFTWSMEDHSDMGMQIKLNFENIDRISTSSYGQDQVKIQVKDFSMF
jgi:hypothetical protein